MIPRVLGVYRAKTFARVRGRKGHVLSTVQKRDKCPGDNVEMKVRKNVVVFNARNGQKYYSGGFGGVGVASISWLFDWYRAETFPTR